MNRVSSLVLAALVLLLNVTLAQSQDRCPADGTEPSVFCEDLNCFHNCCLSSGVCPAFSCTASLDAPNDAGTICTGECQDEVACVPFNLDCPNNEEVCIGTMQCKTANCGGRSEQAGSACLIAGQVIKVCFTVTN